MNYCTKCASIYSQPGTCNCYATVAKPVQPHQITPYIPWVPYTPPSPNTWPPFPPISPVITFGSVTIRGNNDAVGIPYNGEYVTTSATRSDSPWNQQVTYLGGMHRQ